MHFPEVARFKEMLKRRLVWHESHAITTTKKGIGYDETYIYGDIPHESLRERETKEMYERLVARAENRQ